MENMLRILFVMAALWMAACSAPVMEKQEARPTQPAPRKERRSRQVRGQSGQFDFYVVTLSWSPGYCATPAGERDKFQCGPSRQYGFILHGLWPQYEKRGWPQNCPSSDRPDEPAVNAMLDIMPSPRLVRHEWEKHGTCSGLSAKDYLEESREAFAKIKIPAPYVAPLKQITFRPDEMRQAFAQANPEIGEQGFAVVCSSNGRFLQEVRACLTKDLEGRRCNDDVLRDHCRSSAIIMRPLR